VRTKGKVKAQKLLQDVHIQIPLYFPNTLYSTLFHGQRILFTMNMPDLKTNKTFQNSGVKLWRADYEKPMRTGIS
jgi:hypothetical protein